MGKSAILDFNDVLKTYKSEFHGEKALSKYKQWFPLKTSPELAGIVGDLMGDGHLQDSPKLRLDYTSNSVLELNRFNGEIFNIFSLKGKIRDCTTNKYKTKNLGINCKPLARVLKLIGVPTGAKVLIAFNIPDWILKDKRNFSRFMNRLFSCEGCVDIKNKYIEINMYKSINNINNGILFFETIKHNLWEYFGIITTNPFLRTEINIRKDGVITKAIVMKIKDKKSLILFKKLINFDNIDKSRKLDLILNNS